MSFPVRYPAFHILTHASGLECGILLPLNKNRRQRRPYATKRHRDGVIITLDPNNFIEKKQGRLFLGNKIICSTHITLSEQSTSKLTQTIRYDSEGPLGTRWPYPPDTKAFLYYTTPPERPRIGGELRLRVTSSDDPASFANGSDLLRVNGQPWSRPLYTVSRSYIPLYQKLREERLVPDDLDSILSAFSIKRIAYSRGQLLYTLNDTFIIDFASSKQFITIITEQGIERLLLYKQFSDNRDSRGGRPYAGSAMARFERSMLPEHKDTRTVVLRFLKMITPIKCVMPLYDGYIPWPKEGELYHRERHYTTVIKPGPPVWSVNIDKKSKGPMLQGLRLLWDAA